MIQHASLLFVMMYFGCHIQSTADLGTALFHSSGASRQDVQGGYLLLLVFAHPLFGHGCTKLTLVFRIEVLDGINILEGAWYLIQ